MQMELKDTMHAYPQLSCPKYSDFGALSGYDAYIGNITSADIPCNGACACSAKRSSSSSSLNSLSSPYRTATVSSQRSSSSPLRSSSSPLRSISSPSSPQRSSGSASSVHPSGVLSPPPVVLYPHPYPSNAPVIVHHVPHVSETPRVAAKYPDVAYNPQPITPPRNYPPVLPNYHYPPRYYVAAAPPVHYVAAAPPPISSHYAAAPQYHHHYAHRVAVAPAATAPPPAPSAYVRRANMATVAPITPPPKTARRRASRIGSGAKTPPTLSQKRENKAAKARYYGYIAPTTATKTMNNRRQQVGERKQIEWNPSDPVAGNEIVCSFHMDFIPKLQDLRKYLSKFGCVVNKIEIEWDCVYGGGPKIDGPIKGVPLATIRFAEEVSAHSVCDKSCTHVIPSGIKFRAFRSMKHYVDSFKKKKKRKKHVH